ncbi:MAG: hypothetical protein O8C65_06390, partial [Candidatus Methanoperedens sp.]|nr:hypothetical protein [Candidatus Methanoperedens sp.]
KAHSCHVLYDNKAYIFFGRNSNKKVTALGKIIFLRFCCQRIGVKLGDLLRFWILASYFSVSPRHEYLL